MPFKPEIMIVIMMILLFLNIIFMIRNKYIFDHITTSPRMQVYIGHSVMVLTKFFIVLKDPASIMFTDVLETRTLINSSEVVSYLVSLVLYDLAFWSCSGYEILVLIVYIKFCQMYWSNLLKLTLTFCTDTIKHNHSNVIASSYSAVICYHVLCLRNLPALMYLPPAKHKCVKTTNVG